MQECTKNAIILVSVLSEALDYQIMPALQHCKVSCGASQGPMVIGVKTLEPPLNAGRRVNAKKAAELRMGRWRERCPVGSLNP